MRFQPAKIIRFQIRLQEIAQAAIDQVEILACAIRRDVVGTANGFLRVGVAGWFGRCRRVHG
jgi:hypothetical protein